MVEKTYAKIYCKDARSMDDIADSSVHLVVTSPPYFDLKEYNSGEIIQTKQAI